MTQRSQLDTKDAVELTLELLSFAGGENTIGQDQELKSNEARVIENWDSDSFGGMIRTKGFTEVARDTSIGGIDTYTKLILHMDDASLIDSSLTPKTTTLVGSITRSATQSKFGGFSASFDGLTKYLTLVDHADWNFAGGDFTIDGWIYVNNVAVGDQTIFAQSNSTRSDGLMNAFFFDAGNLRFLSYDGSGILLVNLSAPSGIASATWTHVAIVRNANTFTLYVNGVAIGSVVAGFTLADFSGLAQVGAGISGTAVGRFFAGYIDELRISKGIARDFTTVPAVAYSISAYTLAPDLLLHHFEGSAVRNLLVIEGDLAQINGTDIDQVSASVFTSGVQCHGVSAGNKAWITNSTDNLLFATIAGGIDTPDDQPAEACDRIYYHKSRLVAEGGGVTVYGSRGGSDNWDGNDGWSASGDAWSIALPDLTAGAVPNFPSGNEITVFTKFNTYVLSNFPNVGYRPIESGHGCCAPLSAVLGTEGLYFMSSYPTLGIWLWNGVQFINLTINEDWITKVNKSGRIYGIYRENKYWFIYNETSSGVGYENRCRTYDARWGKWSSRPLNSLVGDNFGYPAVLTKSNNELYCASSRGAVVYDVEDTSNSDNGFPTNANYKTKDFTSKDFGIDIDELTLKLVKANITLYGSTSQLSLQWTADRGLHSGDMVFDLNGSGDLLNSTFILNSSILSSLPPDRTIVRKFNNSAIGKRFDFQMLNSAIGDRTKIKKLDIIANIIGESGDVAFQTPSGGDGSVRIGSRTLIHPDESPVIVGPSGQPIETE